MRIGLLWRACVAWYVVCAVLRPAGLWGAAACSGLLSCSLEQAEQQWREEGEEVPLSPEQQVPGVPSSGGEWPATCVLRGLLCAVRCVLCALCALLHALQSTLWELRCTNPPRPLAWRCSRRLQRGQHAVRAPALRC